VEATADHVTAGRGWRFGEPAGAPYVRILGPVVTLVYGRAWARGLAHLKELMEAGQL
jgi:hypothetical protein